jgi:RsiW-degrading membrane proteinase PrsW (M82 family)
MSAEGEARVEPWHLVVGAFLLGAWLGTDPPHVPHNRVVRAAFAMIGSVAVRLARDAAFRELLAGGVRRSARGT